MGDARISLQSEAPQSYDILIVDAFTSDAIPVHLLTAEAFDVYLRHLKQPGGILALHLSNRHVNLCPVALAAAEDHSLEADVPVADPFEPPPIGQVPCGW